jgi:hypothetical protein
MASGEESPYRVDPTGPADAQIRELVARAAARGVRKDVLSAFKAIYHLLETQPHDWGDPEYRTRKEGGMVYHGIVSPLIVWYVVYEPEKVVWLFDVQVLPGSPLAK